jgi:NTP pyrophosphatase (non-canonical NTP hydrolase)
MDDPSEATARLLKLMARLRDPQQGCPWDLQQTFATIAPYTIEEAYEVADAIDGQDPQHLRDELGDLLFQVVFHARMAEERGWFRLRRRRNRDPRSSSAVIRTSLPARTLLPGPGARVGGTEGAGRAEAAR